METLPILVLSAMDPVLRSSVLFSLVIDKPDLMVIKHDLDPDRPDLLGRTIMNRQGVITQEWIHLDHNCMGCAAREDLIPSLRDLADHHTPSGFVVSLPLTMPSLATTTLLAEQTLTGGDLEDMKVCGVAATCTVESLHDDLFGDDLLTDRGLHTGSDDTRSVGEAAAHQIEHADFVVTDRPFSTTIPSGLLERLRAPDSHRIDDYGHQDLGRLFEHEHHATAARERVDPLCVGWPGNPGPGGAWSMLLSSNKPFHPQRLRHNLEDLAIGDFRSRGHFWLPTRPFTAGIWDGAGQQLSIGAVDSPHNWQAGTRLLFTGVGDGRQRIVEAFDASLLTAEEEQAGLSAWLGHGDDFGIWLD